MPRGEVVLQALLEAQGGGRPAGVRGVGVEEEEEELRTEVPPLLWAGRAGG